MNYLEMGREYFRRNKPVATVAPEAPVPAWVLRVDYLLKRFFLLFP